MTALLNPPELPHDQATANLSVEGLALTHFDKASKSWEIEFLRNAYHDFELSITGRDPIDLRDVETITISTVRGIEPDFEQYPNGCWFSGQEFNRRRDEGHPEDFRWVPDFANRTEFPLHALVRRREVLGRDIRSVATLTIPNVVFYTKQKEALPLNQTVLGIPFFVLFGKTDKTIGADISCEEGGQIIITIDGNELDPLPHVPGSPHQIEFKNKDMRTEEGPVIEILGRSFVKGDFALTYQALNFLGVQSEMLCEAPITKSGDCDCNPNTVSTFD